jgi:acetyltransferase-like isoleucine patch superfamily enzyme
LSRGKQAKHRARRPARPISRDRAKAFVGADVTVDEGAILEAGAAVLKDVQPWTIVVGKPARESKRREITQ